MEVKSSFPFDSKVEVDQVVSPWGKADETSDEKCISLYEVPAGIAVDDDASEYQNWKNWYERFVILFISYQLPVRPEPEPQWRFSSFL